MRKRQPRPEYEALVERILAGEIPRKTAAALARVQTGLSEQNFLSWITGYPGLKEKLKPTNGNRGQNSHLAHKDPDKVKAYEEAIAEVMAGRTAVQVAKRYKVNYVYLCRRVRKLQEDMAPKSSPADQATAEALEKELARTT